LGGIKMNYWLGLYDEKEIIKEIVFGYVEEKFESVPEIKKREIPRTIDDELKSVVEKCREIIGFR
jgi:hypothetical protein